METFVSLVIMSLLFAVVVIALVLLLIALLLGVLRLAAKFSAVPRSTRKSDSKHRLVTK